MLPLDRKPHLKGRGHQNLTGAGGAQIKVYGCGTFDIILGTLELREELLVADIKDDVLLGIDVLQNNDKGQADILLSLGEIRLQGHVIPCIQNGLKDGRRRVRSAMKYEIPGVSELIV